MPRRNALLKALARINTKTSAAPAFQPPFNDRPSPPIIRITASSSSSATPASPIIHNSPFPPHSIPPVTITPSAPQSPIQPGNSPVNHTESPISPLNPPPTTTTTTTTTAPPSPPPTSHDTIPHPEYHLNNRYLRTLTLLLTPPVIHAAQKFLADHGYGTGPHRTVTEADELDFFHTLDAFLCLLDPSFPNNKESVGAVSPTAESLGRRCWPEGLLDGVGSRYLGKMIRGLDAEKRRVVDKWVEVKIRGKGLREYVMVVDGFLGVLEGRERKVVVEERAMMSGALKESDDERVEGRLKALKDELMGIVEGF